MYTPIILFFFLAAHTLGSAADQHAFATWSDYARTTRKAKHERAPRIAEFITQNTAPASNEFVTETELSELQIPWLIDTIDYTQTAFGRAQLERSHELLTNDVSLLHDRQALASALYTDPELLYNLTRCLHTIGKYQESILAYINPENPLNKAIRDFYFDGSTIGWINARAGKTIQEANKSSFLLSIGTLWGVLRRCDSFLIALCKKSLSDSLVRISMGINSSLHLDAFLFEGIASTFSAHLPWFRDFDPTTYSGDHKTYCTIMESGTFADKVGAYVTGSQGGDNSVGFSYLPGLKKLRYTWRKASDFTPWDQVPTYKKAFATAALVGTTAFHDYRIIEDGKSSADRIRALFKHMSILRQRLIQVKEILKNIAHLCQAIIDTKALEESPLSQSWRALEQAQRSAAFMELITLLKTDTFSGEKSIFFMYGNVLRAHLLLQECTDELRAIFSAIGELDTYCSVALLMKMHDTQKNQFSFATFYSSPTPALSLIDCWNPLIKPNSAVSNTIHLGCNESATKGIITGPNGGGKSTILKSLGHALYLAHSFGIISAKEGSITPFSSLRTCFHPRENLEEELSQFMAEKKCMDALCTHATNSRTTGFTLLLVDEPYRGTVTSETEERIYTFGQAIAHHDHVALLLATHVEKPIQLERDTRGLFTNYQVLIGQEAPDTFKRTFKIIPGVAHWWFENTEQRSRFIDWLCSKAPRA
jgi:hypothetical protein